MNRAGREPAEDVKRRFVSVCKEVGLVVGNAMMHLTQDRTRRIIYVDASVPDWPHELANLGLLADVPVSGDWPETVRINCTASEDGHPFSGARMTGRDAVPTDQLKSELQDVLIERHEVLQALRQGRKGPFEFEKSLWITDHPMDSFFKHEV